MVSSKFFFFLINVYFYLARMHSINHKMTVKTFTLLQNIFEINAVLLNFKTKKYIRAAQLFSTLIINIS